MFGTPWERYYLFIKARGLEDVLSRLEMEQDTLSYKT